MQEPCGRPVVPGTKSCSQCAAKTERKLKQYEDWVAAGRPRTKSGKPILKHYGPGPHPSGTRQDVHGRDVSSLQPRALTRTARVHQGFTVHDPTGIIPKEGWVVALEGHEEKFAIDKFTPATVASYMQRHKEALDREDTYFGAWIDSETGLVYLDISVVYNDQNRAVQAGKDAHQIAIFNLNTFEEMRLVSKHAQHDQSSHGNWARGINLRETRKTKSYTTWSSSDFRDHDHVKRYIEGREGKEGGAWSYDVVFGLVHIVRAETPSKVPDEYISLSGSPRQLYYRGKWRDFSEKARIREQQRGTWGGDR